MNLFRATTIVLWCLLTLSFVIAIFAYGYFKYFDRGTGLLVFIPSLVALLTVYFRERIREIQSQKWLVLISITIVAVVAFFVSTFCIAQCPTSDITAFAALLIPFPLIIAIGGVVGFAENFKRKDWVFLILGLTLLLFFGGKVIFYVSENQLFEKQQRQNFLREMKRTPIQQNQE